MLKIIKLHIGLFRYIKTELPKQKTSKDIVKFFKNITIAYTKEIIKLFLSMFWIFDKEYRKLQKEVKKKETAKKDVVNALKLLKYSRDKMKKAGISRQRIRRFYLDLSRDAEALDKLVDDLMKEVN